MIKTLHKTLTITLLAVYIFISGVNVGSVGAQNTAVGPAASRRPADLLQSKYVRFDRLTSEDGLSNEKKWGFVQDNQVFMWFATSGELNRYDGTGVKEYRHNPDDPTSIGHNFTRALIADQSGVV